MKRRLILVGIGVALAVALIAILSAVTGGKATNGGSAAKSELVGRHIKAFSIGGLTGGTIEAPWASGHASVLIFFASYCGPCQGEMPKVAQYLRTHDPSPVDVLGVDAIDVRSSAQAMVKRDHVGFPVAFDPNGAVTDGDFDFGQIPESVFLSSKGVVESVYYGAIPQSQLKRGIAMLRDHD